MCTNLKQINPHQWKHIMHRQLSPIGEVGIYKNAIHTLSESVLTYIDLKKINPPQWEHIKHRQLIPIGEVGIYKNATHTSFEGVC